MTAKYFLLGGGLNVVREIDAQYAYSNHQTGNWISDNKLIGPVTGYDGDAATYEVSLEQAQASVSQQLANLVVDWIEA
jgi:hypothetical protein